MTSPMELALLIKQTQAFVDADPETLTITPQPGVWPDGAGGFTELAGPPFQETVRLIPQSDKVPAVTTWEGTRKRVEYIMLAVPAAAARINKGSRFEWRGSKYLVTQIHDKPDYTFKADVVSDG